MVYRPAAEGAKAWVAADRDGDPPVDDPATGAWGAEVAGANPPVPDPYPDPLLLTPLTQNHLDEHQ